MKEIEQNLKHNTCKKWHCPLETHCHSYNLTNGSDAQNGIEPKMLTKHTGKKAAFLKTSKRFECSGNIEIKSFNFSIICMGVRYRGVPNK